MQELNPERAAFLTADYCRGFIRYCRIEPHEIKSGSFSSRVIIVEEHRQQDGFIHAGVMATMADHTAGYAAFTLVP
jgi:acyl-coenzyme A thioesterase PaaI-like protein